MSQINFIWSNTRQVSDVLYVHHQSSRLYIQQHAYVKQILLSACLQADCSICHIPKDLGLDNLKSLIFIFLILSNVLPGSIAWLIVLGLRRYHETLSCGI